MAHGDVCSRCGKQLPAPANYCPNCGQPTREPCEEEILVNEGETKTLFGGLLYVRVPDDAFLGGEHMSVIARAKGGIQKHKDDMCPGDTLSCDSPGRAAYSVTLLEIDEDDSSAVFRVDRETNPPE